LGHCGWITLLAISLASSRCQRSRPFCTRFGKNSQHGQISGLVRLAQKIRADDDPKYRQSYSVHMLQDDATQRTVMCQQRGIRSARLKAEMIQLKGWSLKIELKESCARGFSHGFINP